MTEPRVAVMVLNYNGRQITLDALASLERMTYGGVFDLYHVDNGSSDGSFEAVAEQFPGVRQVRIEDNRGAINGLNAGLQKVLEGDYDYVLSINNDVEVDPAMLTEMVAVAERDPSIGCVGPKVYYHHDRRRLWSAGGIIRFKESVTRERGMGRIDRGQYDRDQEMDYVSGAAVLLRREAIEKVGYWDPIFPFAVEDADWCMRMRRHGYRPYYAHRAVFWHRVSYTAGSYNPKKNFHTARSGAIFIRKYAGPFQWLTFLFFTSLALPAAYLRELPRGNQAAVVAKLRGVVAGLRETLEPPPRIGDPLRAPPVPT